MYYIDYIIIYASVQLNPFPYIWNHMDDKLRNHVFFGVSKIGFLFACAQVGFEEETWRQGMYFVTEVAREVVGCLLFVLCSFEFTGHMHGPESMRKLEWSGKTAFV